MRVWSHTLTATLLTFTISGLPAAQAGVELVQLTPQNIDTVITGDARKVIVPGDVLMRNENIAVAILTTGTPSDTTRAGRCLVLTDREGTLAGALSSLQPGPGVVWGQPEAGSNENLAVLRFHREEANWTSELTYRLKPGTAWVDVVTRVTNLDGERTLELPVVDHMITMDGGEIRSPDEATITLVSKAGPAVGYVAPGLRTVAREANIGWHIGFVSGDPMPNPLRRASQRMLSIGKSNAPLAPLEPGRDWNRRFRDRELWYRLEPKQNRTISRRLVVGASSDALAAIMNPTQKPKSVSPPPHVVAEAPKPTPAPSPAPFATKPPVRKSQPRVATSPKPTPKKPAAAMTDEDKIVGKIRSTGSAAEPKVASKPAAKVTGKLRGTPAPPAKLVSRDMPQLPTKEVEPILPTDGEFAEVISDVDDAPDFPKPGEAVELPKQAKPTPKPVVKEAPKQVENEANFAPIIDAIEELPPPEE